MESAGKYDYIIIGAGSAGCVLANRLAQDKGVSVLLIEAGRKDDYVWIHIPVGYLYCIDNPRTDWRFRTEADPGLNGRTLIYPRGKVMGGSSSINGMIYMRGQGRDYDEWARLTGDPEWRWDRVLPLFKQTEDYHKGADDYHGAGGEWRVERQRLSWEILDAFREAASQTGIPKSDDFNRGDNEGCGYFEVNQKKGLRWNTAKAFLRPTEGRKGQLEIMTGCHVKRLRMIAGPQGPVCAGVEFSGGGTEWFADLMLPELIGQTTREARPDLVNGAKRMMLKMSPMYIAQVQHGMAARPDSVPTLKTIDVPTLLLLGEEDPIATLADGELMRQNISGSRLSVLPKAGHFAAWEQPEAVGKLLRQFADASQKER